MNPIAIRNGLYLGASLIFTHAIALLVYQDLLFPGWLNNALITILFIIFQYKAANQLNTTTENKSISNTILTVLSVGAIGYFLFLIFKFILFKYIDPSLSEGMREYALSTLDEYAEMFSFEAKDLRDAKEEIQTRDFSPTIMEYVKNFLGTMIFPNLILALIVGAVFRRKL